VITESHPRLRRPFPDRAARVIALGCTLLALVQCVTGRPPASTESIAIVGVTVIDPSTSSPPAPDQTILVQNGEIYWVGPSGTVRYKAGTREIDGHGKFAIPGLWDAHVHFMNSGVTALSLFIANGVTSVREMGGYIDSTRAWQARMREGTLVGPRIVTPGPILESPSYLQNVVTRSQRDPRLAPRILPYRIGIRDAADAHRAIDSLRKLRVDFIKFRTTASPEAVYGILRYARRARLRVVIEPWEDPAWLQGAIAWVDGISLMKSAKNIDQAYEFIAFLQTPEVSAALAEGSSYNPVITGADALLSDVAKKNFQEAFPGDALKNLWPWPAEPTWYAEIRSQYADKFKAA